MTSETLFIHRVQVTAPVRKHPRANHAHRFRTLPL